VTQNRVRGRYAIRFSIGQTTTERRHVEDGWAVVREIARILSHVRIVEPDLI
jgi:aromatic-L-amino-acid/L-tryptophan decarboxylase